MEPHKSSLVDKLSLRGWDAVTTLILNAKREMGQICEQGGSGEEAGLRSYLDSHAVTSTATSRGFKGSGIPHIQAPHRAHTQSGHALFKWYHLLRAAHPEPLHSPSFPKSPLLKLSKQTGRKPGPFTSAARGPRVLTGNQALAADGFCAARHPQCE